MSGKKRPFPRPDTTRRALTLSALGLAAGTLLSGCGGAMDEEDTDPLLRFVNGTVDYEELEFLLNGTRVATVENGGDGTAYRTVDVDEHTLSIRPEGSTTIVETTDHEFEEETHTTLLAYGSVAGDIKLRVFDEDSAEPPSGKIAIRGFHAVPGGGVLEVYLTSANASLTGRTPDLLLGGYETLTGFNTDLDGGTYRVRVTTEDQDDLLLDYSGASFADGRVITLVVVPRPNGGSNVDIAALPEGHTGARLTE